MTTVQTPALSPTAVAVLGYLRNHGPATVRDIAQHHRVSFPHALGALCSLTDAGLATPERTEQVVRGRTIDARRDSPRWRATDDRHA